MADDRRRRRGEDFEGDMTNPAGMRREAPRIATPVAPELRPAPAQAGQRAGGGSVAMPPVDTSTPVPAPMVVPPAAATAVPVPVLPERSSRSAAPVMVAPDRSVRSSGAGTVDRNSRSVGAIVERVRERPDRPDERSRGDDRDRTEERAKVERKRDSGDQKPISTEARPVSPAQVAATAAAALTGSANQDHMNLRETMASPAPPSMVTDVVRVHRLHPPAQLDERLLLLRAPDSPAAASFRVLRHRLGERSLKTILVTSPGVGEGKTVCAVNLALALGEAGRARVLLLETNFRRPMLAQILGFRPPICFSEQLEFHRAVPTQAWAVVENVSPWLHTAAVAPDARHGPILDGPALSLCLEQLRGAGYDYIVLDSPPVLGSADVNLIEESVDGILFTLWAKRSRARSLRKAIDQVGMTKVIGTALMGI